MNLNGIASLNIHVVDTRFIINGIRKVQAINLLTNADQIKRVEHCKTLYVIKLGGNEIEKQKFSGYKNQVFLKDVDIKNILICNNISCCDKNYKHLISSLDDDYKIGQLHIML